MSLRRSAGATVVAVALMSGLAGCGSQHLTGADTAATTATTTSAEPPAAKHTAAELVKAMRASVAKATSFQAAGTIEFDFSDIEAESTGTADPGGSMSPTSSPAHVMRVDAAGTTNGSGVRLTVSSDMGTMSTMYVGDSTYFRADKGFFADLGSTGSDDSSGQPSSVGASLAKYANRWISTRVVQNSTPRLKHTLTQLLNETVSREAFPDAKLATATVTPIVDNGVPAYRVDVGKSSLIIAADDASTLRYAVVAESDETQKLRFSQWNTVPAITAPADAIPGSQIPGWDASGLGPEVLAGTASQSDSGSGSSSAPYELDPSAGPTGDGFDPSAATSSVASDG